MRIELFDKKINFQSRFGVSSNYSAYIDRDLNSKLSAMLRILKSLYSNILETDINTLKNFGIEKIDKNIEEGIIFNSFDKNRNFIVSIHPFNGFRMRTQNALTGQIENSVYVQSQQIAKTDTKYSVPDDIDFLKFKENVKDAENFIKEALLDVDYKVLQMRKYFENRGIITQKAYPSIPKYEDDIENVTEPVKPKLSWQTVKAQKIKSMRGVLNDNDKNVVSEIIKEFNSTYANLKTFQNSITRNKVKNNYPFIKKGIAGSKILEFVTNNGDIRTISVNMINDHYKKNLVIKVTNKLGNEHIFVITPDNEVFNSVPMGILRDSNARSGKSMLSYYSQEEIDNLGLSDYLKTALENLKKYNTYIVEKQTKFSTKKQLHSTLDEGNLNSYNKLTASIENNFENYKKLISQYSNYSDKRKAYQTRYGIKTFKGFPYLLFKKITSDSEDLFLAFNKVGDKKSTKVLVMDKKKIKKTFLIFENKLVKFEAKSLFSRPHYDRQLYYYSQEEIEKSDLRRYLSNIENRLVMVNKSLKKIISRRDNI